MEDKVALHMSHIISDSALTVVAEVAKEVTLAGESSHQFIRHDSSFLRAHQLGLLLLSKVHIK